MKLVAIGLAGAGLLASPAVAVPMLDAGTVSPASVSLAAGAGGSTLLVIARTDLDTDDRRDQN